MFGQGSPIARSPFNSRSASWQIGRVPVRLLLVSFWLLSICLGLTSASHAAEKTVRLRLAWGSGRAAKQRWTGAITIDGGELSDLQPLGIEPDAPVAFRIDGDRLLIAPLEKRGFDGCDLTVRADEQATVRVDLHSEQAPQTVTFEASLSEVLTNQLRHPLDELGSTFLAHRSPGDHLRVITTREHYVFSPGQRWNLRLQPDLADALSVGPVSLDLRLQGIDDTKPSWQTSKRISDVTELETDSQFEITCPATEGAYRLTITARPEEGFATRFVPGQQAKPLASRNIEFVVIDPAAMLPELNDQWESLLTIDPANPRWWQRLPAWAQVPRLRDRTPGSVGNVRPLVRPTSTGEIVELPPATLGSDPAWQAYTLPVREPGQPHLVEIEYPKSIPQHLAISIIEPDAAGKVTRSQQDASLSSEGITWASEGEMAVHRFVIWPRTRTPQLLIVNRHVTAPGQYGKIKVLKQSAAQSPPASTSFPDTPQRLVAGYLNKPSLANHFGAADIFDPASGLGVHGWSTFLDATSRLTQSLRMNGYNSVMISVAADGSALYPSQILNPSPRYDTGMLSASGNDPTRKDVLEMLLRVCDREGIRVVPTVQLAAPLPRLEPLRSGNDIRSTGVGCVGINGQSWLVENSHPGGLAPYYNPLNNQVQAELAALTAELTSRYQHHPSFAGVGVQLDGAGYGLLPGLAWGLDDATIAEFSRATGITVPGAGADRFLKRAQVLLGEQRPTWQQWRTAKLSQLFQKMANQVTADRSDLHLILATEEVFNSAELRRRVRQSIAEVTNFRQILLDHGLDLQQLDSQPNITALTPRRLGAAAQLKSRELDLRVNSAAELGELVPAGSRSAELFFHTTNQFRLPSFDEKSPFGAEQTLLTVSSRPSTAGNHQSRQLVSALARNDALTVVEGGWQLGSSTDSQTRGILKTLQQLPSQSVQSRTERVQPLVMRVYRTDQTTIVTLINEAPWPVQAQLALTGSQNGHWQRIGGDQAHLNPSQLAGTIASSPQQWQIDLKPHDLQAWKFEDGKLRVGELKAILTDIAQRDLEQRIAEIETRADNLNIERTYDQLQNPGFELEDGELRIVGWQPWQSAAGSVMLDSNSSNSGAKSLRLQSNDPAGVAVQSHMFAAPETGQLMVRMHLQIKQFAPDAKLQLAVLDADGGRRYRQFAVLDHKQLANKDWSPYEFVLEDIPFGQQEQLRLHFHLVGDGEVLLDDVRLYDLRFGDSRRRALVKRIIAAKIALEQGQVVDCLRVVDDYWSRYLVEHVPPLEKETLQATKPPTKAATPPPSKSKSFGSKLRNLAPKKWW